MWRKMKEGMREDSPDNIVVNYAVKESYRQDIISCVL